MGNWWNTWNWISTPLPHVSPSSSNTFSFDFICTCTKATRWSKLKVKTKQKIYQNKPVNMKMCCHLCPYDTRWSSQNWMQKKIIYKYQNRPVNVKMYVVTYTARRSVWMYRHVITWIVDDFALCYVLSWFDKCVTLTHWPLGVVNAILKMEFSILFYWLVSSDLMIMPPMNATRRNWW